jgi:hypothetical protein
MRLYGVVDKIEIKKFPRFDQQTGAPDPSYMLQALVMDLDDKRVYHQCTFNDGFGLEGLRAACKAKMSEAERDAISGQVLAVAKQLEGQRIELVVGKPKAKGFVSLPVTFPQPEQVAQAV